MFAFFRHALAAPALLLALAAPTLAATTYYVSPSGKDTNPGTSSKPFLTIQHGIDAAANGDTVTLKDGTYTGPGDVDLDFGGTNLTLNSVNGATKTIINCGGSSANNIQHRGFYFHTNETTASVSGVTIQNGYAGIYGGGIDIESDSSVTLESCILISNITSGAGGGIYNSVYGNMTLTRCTFSNNMASYGGGGVFNDNKATLTNCLISGNSSPGGFGGGVVNNLHPYDNMTLTNCIISGNTASNNGGGVSNLNTLTMQFCTLSGNSVMGTTSQGGAVENDGTATIIDSILYGDTAPTSAEIGTGPTVNSVTPVTTVTYSDIKGGYPGTHNLNAKPLFVHTPDPAADPPNFGDLHLGTGSPVIGKGIAISGVTADHDGKTRKSPPTLGAYEFTPAIFSLSPSSATAGSPAFTLAVGGYGFLSNSIVKWNGAAQTTTYVSPTKLTASIPAALLTTASTASVTVVDPGVGTSNSKTFTINALTLLSLSFNPATVTGGTQNTTGTVTLNGAAPAGGAVVSLVSNSSALSFAASTVTVPAGASSATFRAYSHKVTSTKTVTMTAAYGGASKTVTVTVTP